MPLLFLDLCYNEFKFLQFGVRNEETKRIVLFFLLTQKTLRGFFDSLSGRIAPAAFLPVQIPDAQIQIGREGQPDQIGDL